MQKGFQIKSLIRNEDVKIAAPPRLVRQISSNKRGQSKASRNTIFILPHKLKEAVQRGFFHAWLAERPEEVFHYGREISPHRFGQAFISSNDFEEISRYKHQVEVFFNV